MAGRLRKSAAGRRPKRSGRPKKAAEVVDEVEPPATDSLRGGVSAAVTTGNFKGSAVEGTPTGERIKLRKYPSNPILMPVRIHNWEAYQTFNPGAIHLDGKVHLVYRAIGVDGISRFGYATSTDGFEIDERLPYPIYGRKMERLAVSASPSGGGFGGCEDPRIVKIEEDGRIYVTYNAFGPGELRVGFTSIRIDDFLARRWRWSEEKLISPEGEVHKNFVLFPEKIDGRYAILHSISPRVQIAYLDSLDFEDGVQINSTYMPCSNGNGWEARVKSPGPPPIKTEEGWILFYHGLSRSEPWKYKIGVMLLDLDRPEKIVAVSRYPVIEPDQPYESVGFKPGVVYTNGCVVKDGEVIVYYGSADTYVSAAHIPLDDLLDGLRRERDLTKEIEKERLLLNGDHYKNSNH